MTPRVNIQAMPASATAADVVELTRATGLSRFPIYRNGPDDIVGIVHIGDVLAVEENKRPDTPVTDLAVEPVVVPETLPVVQLLDRLRGSRSMAVVIDEYGGTSGVATREDIVEEVVGEVRDEHDPSEEPDLVSTGPGAWMADGSVRLDQLAAVGLRVPDGPYETLAGVVATRLGRIPVEGDTVSVDGWRLAVVSVERHRADRIWIGAPSDRTTPVERPGEGP
jgi:CBS domain containing-hemolysin-like protein